MIFNHIIVGKLHIGLEQLKSLHSFWLADRKFIATIEDLDDVSSLPHPLFRFELCKRSDLFHGVIVCSLFIAHAGQGDELGQQIPSELFFDHLTILYLFLLPQNNFDKGLLFVTHLKAIRLFVIVSKSDFPSSFIVPESAKRVHIIADLLDSVSPPSAVVG